MKMSWRFRAVIAEPNLLLLAGSEGLHRRDVCEVHVAGPGHQLGVAVHRGFEDRPQLRELRHRARLAANGEGNLTANGGGDADLLESSDPVSLPGVDELGHVVASPLEEGEEGGGGGALHEILLANLCGLGGGLLLASLGALCLRGASCLLRFLRRGVGLLPLATSGGCWLRVQPSFCFALVHQRQESPQLVVWGVLEERQAAS